MSNTPPLPTPVIDERPASLAGAWEEPCPADGHGVTRLFRSVFEFPLLGGRMAALHCYGDAEAPLATYVSIFDPRQDPPRIDLDPELHALWTRIGNLRPDALYHPIDPAEGERIRSTFAAMANAPVLRDSFWAYSHSIRERVVDGRRLRLEASQHRDYDDSFTLSEISVDGGQATELTIGDWSDIEGFETAAERAANEARERARLAERERRIAAGEDPDALDDELPF